MKLWTIWVQATDGATWLESAWDDESTAENRSGFEDAIRAATKVAESNRGGMRIIEVNFPDDVVFGAFERRSVDAAAVESKP